MKSLVALAVVLTSKALFTTWPLALEWSLLVVRAKVTFEIEVSGESATTAWDRAHKAGFSLSSSLAGLCGRRCSNLLTLDLCPWIHVRVEIPFMHPVGWKTLVHVRGTAGRAWVR